MNSSEKARMSGDEMMPFSKTSVQKCSRQNSSTDSAATTRRPCLNTAPTSSRLFSPNRRATMIWMPVAKPHASVEKT